MTEVLEFLSDHMGWILTGLGLTVGFIVWLVRLESRATTNSRDLDRDRDAHEKSHKEIDEKIGLTNTRVGLAETQIAELRVTSITRDDLREVEGRLTKSIDGLGDRVSGELDRLFSVPRNTRRRPSNEE